MDITKRVLDPYDRKARLYPALLLILPGIITIIVYLQTFLSLLQLFVPIMISCGIPFLLTQFVRDKGKKKEAQLYKKWNGMPSVAIFRYCDNRLDMVTKVRYHEKLSNICQTSLVSNEEEQANKNEADAIYAAWSIYLRSITRNKAKYHLLFQENINYGFRRNVFGIRHFGIIIGFASFFLNILWLGSFYVNGFSFTIGQFISVGISILFLLCWQFVFTEDWVRIPAEAYAERLVEVVHSL
jgi:hypothetical protein